MSIAFLILLFLSTDINREHRSFIGLSIFIFAIKGRMSIMESDATTFTASESPLTLLSSSLAIIETNANLVLSKTYNTLLKGEFISTIPAKSSIICGAVISNHSG